MSVRTGCFSECGGFLPACVGICLGGGTASGGSGGIGLGMILSLMMLTVIALNLRRKVGG